MDTLPTRPTSRMILPVSALAYDGQLNRFLAAGDECGNGAGAATGYTRTSGWRCTRGCATAFAGSADRFSGMRRPLGLGCRRREHPPPGSSPTDVDKASIRVGAQRPFSQALAAPEGCIDSGANAPVTLQLAR